MPKGEIYSAVEGANGELGFYLITMEEELHTGCIQKAMFYLLPGIFRIDKGGMLSDAIITMSSLNLIAGEMELNNEN